MQQSHAIITYRVFARYGSRLPYLRLGLEKSVDKLPDKAVSGLPQRIVEPKEASLCFVALGG